MEGDNPYLPEEIITNILKRLSMKSLMRFQCVCKHWKNLFKTPSFIEEHLHHSTRQNPSLLVSWHHATDHLQLYLLDIEMQALQVYSTGLVDDIPRDATIIGSSNGLLCVQLNNSSHSILLWNPAIRQVRMVAKPANCSEGEFVMLGFGFSSIVNDYKILRLNISNSLVNQAEVYSLKTGLWKRVESGNLDLIIRSGSFAANGNIFWIGFTPNRVAMLVSYDIALEVFTLILLPISAQKPSNLLFSRLTVHDNKLAMLSHTNIGNLEPSSIDLWVMEEEGTSTSGERWSWIKKYSIKNSCTLFPLTIWRNKMVCHISTTAPEAKDDERNFVLVNLTTNEIKMFAIPKCGISYFILNYAESLVPVGNDHIEEL